MIPVYFPDFAAFLTAQAELRAARGAHEDATEALMDALDRLITAGAAYDEAVRRARESPLRALEPR